MTPLHYAATEGKAEAIAILLDHQAYPNFMDLSPERYIDVRSMIHSLIALLDILHWTTLYFTINQFVLMY